MITSTALRRVGLCCVLLFCVVSFISKTFIDIALVASLLSGIAYIWFYERDHLKNNRYLYYFLGLLFAGAVLSCFSLRGLEGIIYFLKRFRLMFILLPLSVFIRSEKEFTYLYLATFLSAVTTVIYGIIALGAQPFYGYFAGFHKIGRTADMLMTFGVFSTVFLFYPSLGRFKEELQSNVIILLGIAISFWASGMTAIRGAWIGAAAGLAMFGLFFKRSFLVSLIVLSLLGTLIAIQLDRPFTNRIIDEVQSIADIKKDVSNLSRLQLWRAGLDFSKEQFWCGTGAKNTEEPFLAFFDSQPDSYKEKNQLARNFPNDFHNSYLHIFIENGVVFFLLFLSLFVFLIYKLVRAFFMVDFAGKRVIAASIVSVSSFFLTQFFHSDLYSYGAIMMYLCLFAGLFYANRDGAFETVL